MPTPLLAPDESRVRGSGAAVSLPTTSTHSADSLCRSESAVYETAPSERVLYPLPALLLPLTVGRSRRRSCSRSRPPADAQLRALSLLR